MLLELKKVFLNEGESLHFSYEMDMSGVSFAGATPFASPVEVEGRVENHLGIVELRAEVSFRYSAPCDRCAAETGRSFRFVFVHPVVTELKDDGDDEAVQAENYAVDLDGLLRDDVLLELPTKYLCREDCRGLCPECGKNLNEGPCNCTVRQADPRLEVLKKLID